MLVEYPSLIAVRSAFARRIVDAVIALLKLIMPISAVLMQLSIRVSQHPGLLMSKIKRWVENG